LAKNCQQPAEKHTSSGHVHSQQAAGFLRNRKPQVAESSCGSEKRKSSIVSIEKKLTWNLAKDGQKICLRNGPRSLSPNRQKVT
jgi:hypothetical protein